MWTVTNAITVPGHAGVVDTNTTVMSTTTLTWVTFRASFWEHYSSSLSI